MRTYHYSVRIGRGKTTFPTVALGSLRGSLAFFWKGRGVQSPWLAISQTYLSALFSCQRAVAKACWNMNKTKIRATEKPIAVDIEGLSAMLSCGRATARKIGEQAGAKIVIGRRVLYSIEKVKKYLLYLEE